uniref:Uncharacterized protein n=1 Tax=Mus musculus TaxID=10090 RepID=Q9D5N3_MOUSE|nr:unnamed protein product [Mus musculus]
MAPGTAASEERQEHTLRERKTVVRALRSKHLYSLGNFPRCPVSTHLLALSIAVYSSLRASQEGNYSAIFNHPSSQSYHTYPRLALPGPDLSLTHLCVPKIEYRLVQEWFPTYI